MYKTDFFFSSSYRKTPPTGELPEYNKSRRQRKRFHVPNRRPQFSNTRPLDRFVMARRSRKKHPGLRQVLSPKAMYSSGPPNYEVKFFFYLSLYFALLSCTDHFVINCVLMVLN